MEQSSAAALNDWLTGQLNDLTDKGLRRERLVTKSLPGGWCERDGRRLLNFASNDYLDLCHNARVRDAFASVAAETAGSGASALVSGRTEWHERLETTISEFEGTEAALVFPSGYAANLGTLSSLMAAGDTVFCDRLNHASLIDGCRLSGASFKVYRHDELDRLRERLSQREAGGRTFIVTDGVFSMDGTIAPLAAICDIADEHNAIVIVDEAHGTGLLGEYGRGACEAAGVEDRVSVRIGTLSKAVGTLGGFVAGSQELIDYLWNTARSQFFSTALPPAVCAAAVAAFGVIRDEPQRRTAVQDNTRLLRSLLSNSSAQVPSPPLVTSEDSVHIDAGERARVRGQQERVSGPLTPTLSPETNAAEVAASLSVERGQEFVDGVPIVPVLLGSEQRAVEVSARVHADGFLVACIRPPTVPNNTARLRVSLSSAHSEDDIRRLATSVMNAIDATQGIGS